MLVNFCNRALTGRGQSFFTNVRPLLLRALLVIITVWACSHDHLHSHDYIIQLIVVMSIRLALLYGQLPQFLEEDNPASFSKHISTRIMTYLYLCAVNCWLLVAPVSLCYDWQMGSVPLVESPFDWRNLTTVILFLTLTAIIWFLMNGRLPVN